MITFFQKLSETWVAKLIMILLGLSMMSVFGLSSATSFWGMDNTAVEVGDQKITSQKLLLDFDRELRRLNSLGTYTSPQDAVKQGMLTTLIQNEAYALLKYQLTESLGTIASDEAVRNYILNNPLFQSATSGVFDRAVFTAYLAQNGMNEARFAEEMRQELAQKHIFDAVEAVAYTAPKMSEILYAYENETRNLTVLPITVQDVKVTEKPTEEKLKEYYAALQETLYNPEYRSVSYVLLTPETVAENMDVSEADIKKAYEDKKEQYSTAERRLVKQMLFKDEATAKEAMNGTTADNFLEVARDKAGQTDETSDFGWVTKDSVLSELSEAIFSTEKGKIVGPIATDVGYHVLLVSDVEEAKTTPIADVREDIIKEIKSARAYDLMTEKAKKMDEMIASGSSLEDSAKAVSMKVEKIEAVDASGVQKNGEKVFFAENTEVLSALLKYKKGAVSPLMAQGTGFILIRTDEITPMALREFEENGVQEILKNAWTTDKQKEGLKAYAEKVFAEVKKGTPIARVAKKYELTEKDYEEVNKRMLSETLGNQSKDLFGLNEGQMTMLPVGNEGYVIVRVLKIKDANPTEDMAIFNLAQRDFQKRIQTLMNESFMASFAKSREVKINDEAIEKVFAPYLAPTEEE